MQDSASPYKHVACQDNLPQLDSSLNNYRVFDEDFSHRENALKIFFRTIMLFTMAASMPVYQS
jgi:hypothetical protein